MVSPPTFWTQRLVFAALGSEKDDIKAVELLYSDPMTQLYGMAGPPNGFMDLHGIPAGLQHHRNTNFSIMIRPEFTVIDALGKGYGTEAMNWLLAQAFYRFNLHRVGGGTWGFNAPARAMYKKVGFVEEGILKEKWWMEGEWQDEVCLGILASDWKARQESRSSP
ncbi:hypothetical protein P7C70_g6177, partial [Phenoliferia sp. Uapishka_3]